MNFLTKIIDRIIKASWDRTHRNSEEPLRATIDRQDSDRPSTTTAVRSFSVHEAMNGTYITFTRRKFNPTGPDEFRSEMYIVQPDESLIDAISVVLVLTEK